ncbi:MAG: acetylesterase, partial [Solobacterium sp.]|nr:acetylesterase [Solobacterium sp.]
MALIQMDFRSETLKRAVTVNVILPVERFQGPYPTLYLLHGLTDNFNGWLSYTRIRLWAEESGLAVVMPSGENSFYMDILVKDGCLGDFGEFVGRELVDVTREVFPLSRKREDTFLAG